MTSVTSSFYVTGGTMRADAASYVERLADRQIYKGLRGGEFCYVLTSRQMGKSSLMVRTARKLREDGFKVVVLDLTALGQNLTPEQWYTGLLLRVGQQLDLEDELEAFFQANLQVGPCQRFFTAIHKILCEHWKSARPGSKSLGLKSSSGQPDAGQSPRLVIFVDEIDTVRSLPFTTDEFFAAIRECYNRRTEEPIFNQLTFCLLGVATPSDLIKDTRVTPFNIGRRIELTDFSESEMAPLAQGLRKDPQVAAALLQRVYYWTNGHPYLTQRLCQAVAQDAAVLGPAGVNRICNELFLSLRAREQDDNLIFVRERLLRNQTDLTGLLDCYRRILIGESIRDDVTDPLQAQLRLAGITRARDGRVFVHNLIYKRVFSLEWVAANMPQAELLRQRAAFRRGLIRAASISAVVLMVMALFLAYSIRMSRLAQRSTSESRDRLVQLQIQNGAEKLRLGNLATAAPWFAEALRLEKGRATLEEPHRLRLASILQSMPRLVQVWSLETAIHDAAISPNGEWIAVALENKTARLFHIQTGAPVGPAMQHDSPVRSLAFSPDGRWLVTGAEDPSARIWELGRNRAMEPPLKQDSAVGVGVVRFSPNGRWIVTGTMNGTARIWDATSGEPVGKPMQHEGEVSDAIFSPNNLWIAVAWRMPDKPGAAGVWNAQTGEPVTAWLEHTKGVRRLAFSPDGKMLATGCEDFHAYVWNLPEGKQSVPPLRHYSWVVSATFS
ncbi:MAG: AAA-like domain-containing protein, partial [Verrucomicrobiota bacterium]